MDDARPVIAARRVLHAVAEQLLAGPQYRQSAEISLAVTDRGFATTHPVAPGIDRIDVTAAGASAGPGRTAPFQGTITTMAAALGVIPGEPENLYHEHAELGPDDDLRADPDAVAVVLQAFVHGAQALKELDPSQQPVLWPEHFDVGISLDEVNYGVSPGDATHDQPYAYVGPWVPRTGEFWNETFGAARPLHGLDGVGGILDFFRAGRREATQP